MKVCYFGIYDRDFSRNRIYISGLRSLGVEVIEVCDRTSGLRKWKNLATSLSNMKGEFDAVIVGYPGHVAVPLARFFAHGKPVVADLLGSLSDAERNSHREPGWRGHWKLFKAKAADELGVVFADAVLLESEAQKDYFEQLFGPSHKYRVLYTGSWLSPRRFYAPNQKDFVVLFRGSLTPECGIDHILDAVRILSDDRRIKFKIVGRGKLLDVVESRIKNEKLSNVELVSKRLSDDEFARVYDGVSLALGQFEDNPRLSRTIPHKAFEALAVGVPYLSGAGQAVQEIIVDGETGFIVPLADAKALAEKIRALSIDMNSLRRVSDRSKRLFQMRFVSNLLAKELLSFMSTQFRVK
ncbi:MAG TPA: glycosyltransferase [Candidatus Paceibacterota bacterium]|jgi:Glycosyltransferase